MANYAVLKAAINAVIKTNGNKEITGQVLNQTLMAIVNSLGENYQFAGVAVPSTNPGTPDQNIFYFAAQAGTYTNFGAIVLPAGISMLEWKNNTWSSETFFTIDDAPTSGSDNLIKSGAVFDAFKNDGGAYDVSVHFPTGGVEGGNAYTLDGAIAMVPQNMRKGGMSIKFVSSSDNKYVQYRLMADEWSTTVRDWQGVDDVPTAGSENLVKSGGVENKIGQLKEIIGGSVEKEVTETLSVNFVGTGGIYAVNDTGQLGQINSITNSQYSDYVDISNRSILSLNYLRMRSTSLQQNILVGICFYDVNKVAISGIRNLGDQSNKGTIDFTTNDIPANAAYIRFSCYNEFVENFYASVKYIDIVIIPGLVKQVEDLEEITHDMQESVESIDKRVEDLEEIVDGGYIEEFITTPLSVSFIDDGGIFAVDASAYGYPIGSVDPRSSTKSKYKYSDYVDIRNYVNKNSTLIYLNMINTSVQSNIYIGACFYDSNYEPISGVPFKGDSATEGIEISTVDIPTNAAYIRFSVRKTFESEFTANVKHLDTVTTPGLVKQVEDLEDEVEDIKTKVYNDIIINEGSYIDYTNGFSITNLAYGATDYIKIRGFEKFSIPSFTVSVPSNIGLAFYNRNKQYVSGIHYPYKNSGYSFIRYIAPAEACYVRFTVLPNSTPYIDIESQAPIAPYFNTYLAFNTPQAKGQFKIFMNFNNGVMLGSCGNDKLSSNDDILIYRSTDWGITWTYIGNATQEVSLQLREGLYYGDHDGNGNAVVGSGDLGEHYLLKITNYGESWPSDYKVVANATSINNIVGINTNGVENVVYCGNNTYRAFCNSMGSYAGHNAVIESNDGGETWHTAASTQPLLASLRSIYKDSKGVLWGAGMHGDKGVWKSIDNGLNWTRKSYFLAFKSIIEYNGYLFCGAMNDDTTEAYVYRSADNGETWDKVLTVTKFTPIYHRTFIPYKNALQAVFCQGEGSTSNEVSWQMSLDNGDTWGEIQHTGIYEGGFVELVFIIGDTYYINTHGGLQKM